MKKIFFLLCLKLLISSQALAQCIEAVPLVNGDFSNFVGPLTLQTITCTVPVSTFPLNHNISYFSSTNLPNWKRLEGLPYARLNDLGLTNYSGDVGSGWHCGASGMQSVAANYPFLKNGIYEITLNYDNWINSDKDYGNALFNIWAVSGLPAEPIIPSYPYPDDNIAHVAIVSSATLSAGHIFGSTWQPLQNHYETTPGSRIFNSITPLASNYDQIFMRNEQSWSDLDGNGDSRGFRIDISSVKIKLCNGCPAVEYLVYSGASADPVSGGLFADGGLFVDAAISIDGDLPLTNNPSVNSLLEAKVAFVNFPMTIGHSFTATANFGKFFEIIPNPSCADIAACYEITGPETILCFRTNYSSSIDLDCATPGGTWSSSNPSVGTVDGSGVVTSVSPFLGGTTTITYTTPNCFKTKLITVQQCGGKPYENNFPPSSITNASELQVYPNPIKDNMNVSYGCKSAGQLEISIRDISGRTRYTETVFCEQGSNVQRSIDANGLNPGVYFVELTLNDQHVIKKIVKQ